MANSGAKRSAVDAFLNFVRNKAIRTRVLALSLLFFAAKLGVEHLFFHDFLGVSEQDLSIVARFYQPITKTLGVRRKPQNCTLLRLQSPSAPQLEMGDCAFRSKLAQVLSKLVQYQPRGVLADYTLRNLECCSETARLIAVAQRACTYDSAKNPAPIPVVFGYDLGSGPKVLSHTSIVPAYDSRCAMGITNPPLDLRTVPLEFSVDAYPVASLAWAMSQLVDGPIRAEFDDRIKKGAAFYTMLLNDDDFRQYTITDGQLLSGNVRGDAVRGRVVIIGSGDDPVFSSAFGPLQSHVLQASYVEALLDRHILGKIPDWITFFVAVIFWYLIESRPPRAGLAMLLLATSLLLFVNLIVVRIWNIYGDFAVISIAGLFVWMFTVTKERIYAKIEPPKCPPGQ